MPYFAARNFCSELGNTSGQFLSGQQLQPTAQSATRDRGMTEYQFSRGDRSAFFAMPDARIVMMSGDVVSS